jgi:hypothetical protein
VENIASAKETDAIKNPYGIFSKIARGIRSKIFKTNTTRFIPGVLEKKGDIYLDGFWETEKYFKDISDIIRKDFHLKVAYGNDATIMSEMIGKAGDMSVSIHIRRTDVALNKENIHHGMTEPYYYNNAMAILKQKIKNPLFFVFSDDIAWCKENIELGDKTIFVIGGKITDCEELFLMSQCRQHIIANSTFSWWAAWLDPRPDKIVLAPKVWRKTAEWTYHDTVPETWTLVENIPEKKK